MARMSANELKQVMAERFGEDIEIVNVSCAKCGQPLRDDNCPDECACTPASPRQDAIERPDDYDGDGTENSEIPIARPALPIRTPGVERHVQEIRDLWDWLQSSPRGAQAATAAYQVRTPAMADAVREALGWDEGETSREDGETIQVSHCTVDQGVYRCVYLRVRPC